MKVKVEACWAGSDKHRFRLTLPGGARESVPGDTWNRAKAKEALDLLEQVYGLPRSKVRFQVR